MPSRIPTNIIYNRYNIETWESELTTFEKKAIENEEFVSAEKLILEPLYAVRKPFLDNKNELQHKRYQITTQIELSKREIENINYRLAANLARNENRGYSSIQTPEFNVLYEHPQDFSSHLYIHTLRQKLSALEDEQANLDVQLSTVEMKINKIECEIFPHESKLQALNKAYRKDNAHINWLKEQIMQANKFLTAMQDEPQELLATLKENIITAFKKYDTNHPVHQSPDVRLCLYKIKKKIQRIIERTPRAESQYSDYTDAIGTYRLKESARLNYLCLCGFLWQMYNNTINVDQQFATVLQNLIEATHVSEYDDLPDNFKTGYTIDEYFSKVFCQFHCDLFCLTKEELEASEPNIYQTHLSKLEFYMNTNNTFGLLALKIKEDIQKEIKQIEHKNKHDNTNIKPDYKFYSRVVRDYTHVLEEPHNPQKLSRFSKLAEVANGLPSRNKQIAGIILATVGLLLFAGGIATLIGTGGISALPSAISMGIGLSLLNTEIVTGIFFSVATVVGAGLSFFGGHLHHQGKRQGLSKDIQTAAKTCREANEPRPKHRFLPCFG